MFSLIPILILGVSISNAWDNGYDEELLVACPPNEVIYDIKSHNDDFYEDRLWDFSCRDAGFSLGPCFWSGYLNTWDAPVDFRCPIENVTTYAMAGVHSVHNDFYEDRRWDFQCCELIANCPPNCTWTENVNTYDAEIDFTVPEGSYLNGMYSTENDFYEDRLWKYNICLC